MDQHGDTLDSDAAGQPLATYEVRGAAGVRLHAREWGRPDGPEILFIHGWSQSDLCWTKQVDSSLADEFRMVSFDLRGHGLSEKPVGAEHYTDGRRWADDIASVLEQTGLTRPVVVAWSYGGLVVCDYLRAHGDHRVAGIQLVAGAVEMTKSFHHIGPGLLENARGACSSDLAMNIVAVDGFLRACTAEPLPDDELRAAFGWNMVVPPDVRAGLFAREVIGWDVLADLARPVRVAHGTADAIVLPSMSEEAVRRCGIADVSWYDGVGHMPFWEATGRFNLELAQFADELATAA
jgi:pimeloyl-ACP methyl ester carboxylesterase